MASALVTSPLAVAKSFSPGHITGFFDRPKVQPTDVLLAGSTGAGFSIDRGISTTVQVHEARHKGYKISFNGKEAVDAEVSKCVIEKYLGLLDRHLFVSVDHDVGIPIGYGLGSSGAAALSLSYSLNKALGIGLSQIEAAQIAHAAEIQCKTGLGTVIAEFVGGFEMRLSIGAPGRGTIASRTFEDYKAVILCMSPISTKKILASSSANQLGMVLLNSLREKATPEEFMRLSSLFAENLGITKGICQGPIKALAELGQTASVALFGETVFALVPKADVLSAMQALGRFKGILFACNIDAGGARLL